ncbi:VanZ family protein [Paenibacillus sp. N4]|uniref:VanZ family protein n=1 Tax=Paenibacillus vietnamensis TaxID=2590547 RepID=UPI001CD14923|nr:VanZ family protein [Paenibacillus vietnamensis]MCA0756470.1 VanZ family protein [Paenibacillus vietnamensis]
MRKQVVGFPSLLWGALFAGWLWLLFTFSSQSYEQQSIQPWLRRTFNMQQLIRLLPDMTITYRAKTMHSHTDPFQFVEFLFRKGAHLFVYAMLAAILFMLMRSFNPRRWLRALAVTLVTAWVVPALDEWNQLSSVHRTGNVTDVWLDFVGGCAGVLVCLCILGVVRLLRRR